MTSRTKIHSSMDFCRLPENVEEYTSLIVSGNLYQRLLSGFLRTSTNRKRSYRHLWIDYPSTFFKFVNALINEDWKQVERHHFTPREYSLVEPNRRLIDVSVRVHRGRYLFICPAPYEFTNRIRISHGVNPSLKITKSISTIGSLI